MRETADGVSDVVVLPDRDANNGWDATEANLQPDALAICLIPSTLLWLARVYANMLWPAVMYGLFCIFTYVWCVCVWRVCEHAVACDDMYMFLYL